jgi:chromosome segregation ATPase
MQEVIDENNGINASVDKRKLRVAKAEELVKEAEKVFERAEKNAEDELEMAQQIGAAIMDKMTQTQKEVGLSDDENEEPAADAIDPDSVEPKHAPKKPAEYKAKIDNIEKQIKHEAEKKGEKVDPAKLLKNWTKLAKSHKDKEDALKIIGTNIDNLKADMKERRVKFRAFRAHIGRRTNNTFDELLNRKGSSGHIAFDSKNRTLNLTVQKDNKDSSTKTNDVKALSGGEKSFTTLSLLLALGESLETPFRIMDEFDVFLDAQARKIALKALNEQARAMDHRQFIFLTPQDLSSLVPDDKLKIINMIKPVRGQQTIGEALGGGD